MRRRRPIPHLGGARALVLHRLHADASALLRQLGAIGLNADSAWPDLPADAALADFVFLDADRAADAQLPWPPGEAPMPVVALIGAEAPGRVEWALNQRADAHLVKPIGNAGVYSALLIARQRWEERQALHREIAGLKAQLAERRTVVRAMLALSDEGMSEAEAYSELRRQAMDARVTVEDAAARLLEARADKGGARERTRRS
ncbi:MAG TPA: ANTAR domain-containing protein [Mesorhizobium sp.]|jgi:AmiR/NasT family two-component response regulator|nr:ANTAR domain-containing protein [Mesorhizobium sp.]